MRKWNMTRTVSSLAVAAMLTLMAGGAASAADTTPANFPKEPVTIEIWWHEYGPFTAYVKELIEAYKKVRPNVTINPVVTSSGDINQKLTVALATGTGPDIMDPGRLVLRRVLRQGGTGAAEPRGLRRQELRGAHRDVYAGRHRLRYVRRQGLCPALSGQFDEPLHQQQAVRRRRARPQKDAPKTWKDMKALGPKLKKVEGNRTVQKAFDFPYHSPRWEMQDSSPDRAVRRQDPERRWQDRLPQQPRDGEGADAVAGRDQGSGDPKTTMNTPAIRTRTLSTAHGAMWITGPWATPQIRQSPIKDGFHRRGAARRSIPRSRTPWSTAGCGA